MVTSTLLRYMTTTPPKGDDSMGRENCSTCHFLGTEMFCDYYDFAYMKCSDNKKCPEGLDDDDYDYPEGWDCPEELER